MSFDFEVYNSEGDAVGKGGDGPKVDWDGLNKYIVDTCGLQAGDVLTGYLSVIYDLGVQTPSDNEYVFLGSAEDEAKISADDPTVYFKDGKDDKGKPARMKCSPAKPFQHVTFAVDFPDIMLDKATFFGEESNPKPLRLYLGGDRYVKGVGFVVQNPLSMKNTTKSGPWSFDPKSTIYKMAVGAKLISDGEPFQSKDVGKLIGKSLQFQVQVALEEYNGKHYLKQKIKLVGGLGRNQSGVDPVTKLGVISFNKVNDPEIVAEIPKHIINTIKLASNYSAHVDGKGVQKDDSVIKGELEKDAPVVESTTEVESGTDNQSYSGEEMPF